MNDRELLELAAKAAGYVLDDDWDFDESWGFRVLNCSEWWNPLTDDGDALRLAVKLDLQVLVGVASRRAIVRAAAEIGRAIQ